MHILKRLTSAVIAAGILLLAAGPVHADWLRAETAHFIVYGDVPERELRAYAERAERFDGLLRAYYPVQVDHEIPKLEIFLANGRRDMVKASPRVPQSVAGWYSPNSPRIYTVVDLSSMGGNTVLFHEYAHHFMFQMRSGAYPSWFIEGFAEYYAMVDIRRDRIQFGLDNPGRMNSLTMGTNMWAPMEDVLTWRIRASGRYPGHLYYAQAWGMTHYFMSTPERTRMLGQYLSAVARGEPSVSAMQAATGRTPEQLQSDVRRYLSGSVTYWTPQIDIPIPEVEITRLSPAESALAWLQLRIDASRVVESDDDEEELEGKSPAERTRILREREEAREDRQTLITTALATAARFPGDRTALLVTAKAQRLQRNPAAAVETLQPLLSDSSTDADALRVAAFALLDQTDAADPEAEIVLRRRASGYLARSMDADPLNFQTYLGLNDVRRGQVRYPTDNDLSTLHVAISLAPQSFDSRMRLAEAFIARGMNAEAIQILQPVANSPHSSGFKRRARQLIATASGEAVVVSEPEPEDEGAETAAPSS
ncbi:DUF1570 domain-containing protein [Brevundimonas sp. FT23042]|uniref:DUF1570 domain-containing protein n=1 Tax=Brevundimonas sp. FT23042 TaxID=3393749 RepID=UPI003B586234